MFSTSDGSAFVLNAYGNESLTSWTLQPPNDFARNLLVSGFDRGDWFAFLDNAATPGRVLIFDLTSPLASLSFDIIDID